MTNLSEIAQKIERIPAAHREAIVGLMDLMIEAHREEVRLQLETQQEAFDAKLKAAKEIADAMSAISSLRFAAICWVIGTMVALAAALRFF